MGQWGDSLRQSSNWECTQCIASDASKGVSNEHRIYAIDMHHSLWYASVPQRLETGWNERNWTIKALLLQRNAPVTHT